MLLDVTQQRIGDVNLIAHAGNHGLEQIGAQLLILLQPVVVMGVDVVKQVIHQRIRVIGIDGAGCQCLNLPRRNIDAQPVLFGLRDTFAHQRTHQINQIVPPRVSPRRHPPRRDR